MAMVKSGLAALAALGLIAAPAAAQTRSAQALPAPVAADRAAPPVVDANELGARGLSPALIIAFLAILAAILAAAGGGGGGNDSPG